MKTIKEIYRKYLLQADLLIAMAVSVSIVAYLEVRVGSNDVNSFLHEQHSAMYGTLASIFGSLLGFVMAAVSIVLVFGQMPRMKAVRNSDQYSRVFHIFFQAITWLSLGTLVTMIGLLWDTDADPCAWMAYATIVVSAAIIARLYRCFWVMKKITELGTQKPE